jgi:hypothetical protein
MAIDTAIYDADLAEMIGDESHTITIAGTAYAVSATDETVGAELDEAGWGDKRRADFTVRVSVLGTVPPVGTLVTYKGRAYRLQDTARGQDDVSVRLICEVQDE